MRAAVITALGGPEVLQIQEVARPEPMADQVRVRVHAAGLNRADLLQRAGGYPTPPGAPATIPGLEIAGEVDAAGPDAHGIRVGERVFRIVGGGAPAEYALTSPDLLAPIPANLDYIAAAAVPEVFMTAYDALFSQAELGLSERVLVHGQDQALVRRRFNWRRLQEQRCGALSVRRRSVNERSNWAFTPHSRRTTLQRRCSRRRTEPEWMS